MRWGRGESDLKMGHVRPLNECARSHSSRGVHSVCEMGPCAQANVGKLEHKPMSAIKLTGVRSIAECINFKQRQKLKFKILYKRQQIKQKETVCFVFSHP